MDEQAYISVKDAADRKGVSQTAVYKAIQEGRLVATRFLGRLALRIVDVDRCEFGSYAGIERVRKPRRKSAQGEAKSTS